ncbi:MAG: hypothetical protein JXB47_08970 [Anaerolineae bacterium]|nr:hypothetical protein [Anaerolineae bacterium]
MEKPKTTVVDLENEAVMLEVEADMFFGQMVGAPPGKPKRGWALLRQNLRKTPRRFRQAPPKEDKPDDPELKAAVKEAQLLKKIAKKIGEVRRKRNQIANLKFYQEHAKAVKQYLGWMEDAMEGINGKDLRVEVSDDGGGPDGGTIEGRVRVRLDRSGFTIVKDDSAWDVGLGRDFETLKKYLELHLDEDANRDRYLDALYQPPKQ